MTSTDPNGTADVYSYTYDENGIRSSKTVNGVTTYFTTKDGVILSQTDGTNTMYFQYDNSGNPTGFIYNGTQYFYLTNQMPCCVSCHNRQLHAALYRQRKPAAIQRLLLGC